MPALSVPSAPVPSASLPSVSNPSALRLSAIESPAAPISTGAPSTQEQAQRLLRALAEPIRLQVVQALQHGERCVCDLTTDLDLAQSKLSFHLKVLKEAGLIRARQEGRWMYYRLDPAALIALQDWLGQLAAGCRTPAPPCG